MINKIMKKLRIGERISNEELAILNNEVNKNKKYGLVWEDHPEDVDLDLKDGTFKISNLKNKEISNNPTGRRNLLLEGDNLHSLIALKKAGIKVDVIYIDPPYNTGNEFIYNDKIVGKEDEYRHSRWLSFMSKRLKLARDLLSDDGLIFVSIDENEHSNLMLLMNQIFDESNILTNFIWVEGATKMSDIEKGAEIKGLSNNSGSIRKIYENIICFKKSSKSKIGLIESDNKYIDTRITNSGSGFKTTIIKKGTRCDAKNLEIKGIHNKGTNQINYLGDGLIVKDYKVFQDVEIEAELRNKNFIEDLMNGKKVFDSKGQEFIGVFINNSGTPYTRKKSLGKTPFNIISGFNDSSAGTDELRKIFGDDKFDYPKPVDLIKYIISLYYRQDDITVLDFFAGSGTTGQAVMELNKEDGGNRRFILCTNNENNICEEVTYERIRRIITGEYETGLVDPTPNNLSYYKIRIKNKKSLSLKEKRTLDIDNALKSLLMKNEFIESRISDDYSILTDIGNKEHLFVRSNIINNRIVNLDRFSNFYIPHFLSQEELLKNISEDRIFYY